jgi:hypothetical protein
MGVRNMKKTVITILAVMLAVILAVGIAKDPIARISVEKGVEMATGLKLSIDTLNIGILKTVLEIKELKLFNPPGYEDKVMLDMPEIYVDYNLPAILGGKIHLRTLRINMSELVVVKNAKGELNLNALNVVKEQKAEKKEEPVKKEKAPEIRIDVLELKVGRVLYKDYSKGGAPSVQEFKLNINERYTDIDDPNELVSLIIVRAITNTSIARLTNFDIKALEGTITGTLAAGQQVVGQAGALLSGTGGTAAQLTQTAGTVAKETTEAAKKTVEDLQKAIKLPFGAKEE